MNRRTLIVITLVLLMLPEIGVTVNADVSQSALAPTGSGDLTVGQVIALTVSAAVAIAGLWLYFRPKNKSEKLTKTAITPSRIKKASKVEFS